MSRVLPVLAAYLLVGALIVLLLRFVGRPARILTPISLFVSIEVLAVWPALVPGEGSVLADVGSFPAILAAAALLTMVITYLVCGGSRADGTNWRGEALIPGPKAARSMTIGLTLLVSALLILGLFEFGGLPPLMTGGFSSLLDPLGNADQAAIIRETRRSLTKGHTLLGDAYAGQGFINTATEAGWRIAVVVALLRWLWIRSRGTLHVFIGVAVLAFLFLGSAGSRSPLVLCVVAGVAALALRRQLRTRQIVAVGLVALSFVLLITPLSKGASAGETATQRLSAISERVTDGNGQNNAQIVYLISAGSLEQANGTIFVERLQAMLPGTSTQDPFALRVTRLAYGGGVNTTGYSTPTQFGLLYADGGNIGVLVGYALSGMLLAFGWRKITAIRSPLGAVIAVEGAILLGYLSVTGIHGVVATGSVSALALLIAAGPRGWRSVLAALSGSVKKEYQPS